MKAISWSWTPVLALTCAAIANAVMLAVVAGARVDSVAGARSGSGAHDVGVDARVAFARSGAHLLVEPVPDGARLTLIGGSLRDVVLACERPSDARLDRSAAWVDTATPLAVSLPANGRWSFRLTGVEANGARVERIEEVMLP